LVKRVAASNTVPLSVLTTPFNSFVALSRGIKGVPQ
jgi:hypothetical protein